MMMIAMILMCLCHDSDDNHRVNPDIDHSAVGDIGNNLGVDSDDDDNDDGCDLSNDNDEMCFVLWFYKYFSRENPEMLKVRGTNQKNDPNALNGGKEEGSKGLKQKHN